MAVIRIDARDLPAAVLGDSDDVKVGEWVLAVGNPFRLMHTVTAGHHQRQGPILGRAGRLRRLHPDRRVHQSGQQRRGPGRPRRRIVGINTAITSPSGGSIGIGFAIPINMARKVMDELVAKGQVVRGYVGVTLQPIDENMAQALKLKGTDGALVGDVVPDGPADKAGIKRGDVVVSVDGAAVPDSARVRNLVAEGQPGKTMTLGLFRNRTRIERTVTLAERPRERGGQAPKDERNSGPSQQKLGLAVQDLTPDIAQQLGYKDETGTIVAEVVPGSPADDAGLETGDLIQEFNRVPVRTARDFERLARGLRSGDAVALLVRRGAGTVFLSLKVQ